MKGEEVSRVHGYRLCLQNKKLELDAKQVQDLETEIKVLESYLKKAGRAAQFLAEQHIVTNTSDNKCNAFPAVWELRLSLGYYP